MSELLSRLMNAMLFTSMIAIGLIWVQEPEPKNQAPLASVVLGYEASD